tara:strand:- start:3046 stop:3684 length:639 start_codon:yes stop_codon:yes gene_type:complete
MSATISYNPSPGAFDFTKNITKPLPREMIAAMRQHRSIMKKWITQVIRVKQTQVDDYIKQKNYVINKIKYGKKYLRENPTEVAEDVCFTIEDGAFGFEPGKYRYLSFIPFLANTKQNLLEVKLQIDILNHLYKQNKDKSRELITNMKLMFGERLEEQMETNEPFKVTSNMEHTGHVTIGKYEANQEQGIIKMAELLQERCNMYENIFDIMMD